MVILDSTALYYILVLFSENFILCDISCQILTVYPTKINLLKN